MNRLVCVILINYNGTQDTIECVESLLKSDYDNFRIVILDNDSNSPISEKDSHVLQHEKVSIVYSDENLGFAGGNNYAIRYAKEAICPDYFLLLNNDTVVKQDMIRVLVERAAQENEVGIVTGKIMLYDTPDIIWYAGGDIIDFKADHFGYGKKDSPEYNSDGRVNFCTGCLWLLPAAAIEQTGLFDEKYFLYYEDVDYCRRIAQNGLKMYYTSQAVIFHKVHASAEKTSGNLENYYVTRNGLYYISKYGDKKVRQYVQYLHESYSAWRTKRIKLSVLLKAYVDFALRRMGKQRIPR